MSNKKRDFYYNKGNYLWKLKPQIEEQYFVPKLLVQFGLVLPYFIPFPERSNLFYKVNSEEVCHLLFTSFWDKQSIFTGAYKNEPTQVDIKRTRVEVTYSFKRNNINFNNDGEDSEQDKLTEVFETALSKLNIVIEAYLAKTKDDNVFKLTKEHFDLALFCRISNGQNYKEITTCFLTLHINAPNMSNEYLSHSKTNEIMNFVDVIGMKLNPFVSGNEFMIEARRNFATGNYRQAIINAQTSVEIFMFTIYREFLKLEGHSKDEITIKSERMRYRSLVVDQFSPRIDGDFNVANNKTRVGEWWLKTYLCRNKIVHEGYYPTFCECDEAIYHATDVIEYIIELLYKLGNKEKYSSITNYFTN